MQHLFSLVISQSVEKELHSCHLQLLQHEVRLHGEINNIAWYKLQGGHLNLGQTGFPRKMCPPNTFSRRTGFPPTTVQLKCNVALTVFS